MALDVHANFISISAVTVESHRRSRSLFFSSKYAIPYSKFCDKKSKLKQKYATVTTGNDLKFAAVT